MKVTEVKITKRFDDNRALQAFAQVIIDDILSINGWKVLKFDQDLKVLPPSERGKNRSGETAWYDSVQINYKTEPGAALLKDIQDSVLRTYGARSQAEPEPQADDFVDNIPF